MVSDWMENGTINQFVENDRGVNRVDLVGYLIILALQRLTRR